MIVDLCCTNARIVNVATGEIYPGAVSIHNGKIWSMEECDARIVLDLNGRFIAPGLIEGHVHLESSHVLPGELVDVFLRNGVTTVVNDPHEIANAGGMDGIRFFLEHTDNLPVHFYSMAPSCVPASPLETAGYTISAENLRELRKDPRILGLAEVMNFPAVVAEDSLVREKCDVFHNGIIDGHAPGLRGAALDAYIRAGIYSDHETSDTDEAREKMRKGMYIMIREGSAAKNGNLVRILNASNDSRFMLVSDDNSPSDMAENHYLTHRLRLLVRAHGIDPLRLLKGVTINPAQYFRLHTKGLIAPGYDADCVVFDSLDDFRVYCTISDGRVVYGTDYEEPSMPTIPHFSAHMPLPVREFFAADFNVVTEQERLLRVITVKDGQLITGEMKAKTGNEAEVSADTERDIIKIAVIERYSGNSGFSVGFVNGIGLKKGALATSYNHDAHNLTVIGTDDHAMARAVNLCAAQGGGVVYVADDDIVRVPFPVFGLMSDLPLKKVAGSLSMVTDRMKAHGCKLTDPLGTISFLSLSVIPALKITDKGLIEASTMTIGDIYV